jgi:hypothetical protein
MVHVANLLFGNEEVIQSWGLWAFLSISTIAIFGIFIPLVSWIDGRRKEREAFYKAETFRRLAEASGEGAKAVLELLREEERLKRMKTLEGLKMAGPINIAVGIGLTIFLRFLIGGAYGSPYLVGLMPALIGVAMLIYVYFLAEKV